jgi:alkanesulfonate monooxygenase SsuD/methylene tetrahydromethanopterin reductase-like flavin-dependent oxidoreductase (luciferase family)
VTLPAIQRGLDKAGRSRSSFQITCPVFVVTGADAESFAESRAATAKQIAFYGSTPAYRGVLELHGWGELQTELNAMSKRGEWVAMGERISDEILEAFAVVAEPEKVPGALKERFGGVVDRVLCTFPWATDAERRAYLEELRAARGAGGS